MPFAAPSSWSAEMPRGRCPSCWAACRPEVAWQALTGFAAKDAQAVIISTDRDEYEVEVQPDGFFVTLAQAPWGTEPGVRIRTRSGQLLDVQI